MRKLFAIILIFMVVALTGCGTKDSPENALADIQVALAERNFKKLSERVNLENFFAQIYDDGTVELAKNYDYYKEKYPDDLYFQHDAEFLERYNTKFRERHLKFLQGVQASYFAKFPKPETPEENPYAYVANEFEETLRAVHTEIQNITVNENFATMTLAIKGDETLRGQFVGDLIFKISFIKDADKWYVNRIENLDELTPLIVDKAEIVWINFF